MRPGKQLQRLSLVVALAFPAEIGAQNILVNSYFDTNLGGWGSFGPAGVSSAAWDPLDSGGTSVSGSALLTNSAPGASTSSGIMQCVPIVPNVSYLATMMVRVPGAVSSVGYPALQINWFTSTNCSGSPISSTNGAVVPPADVWAALRTVPATAPANAITASVQAYIFKTGAVGAYQARVDDVKLMPSSVTLTIPASASIHGQGSTFFHTDVWIVNNSLLTSTAVTLRHRCFASQSCGGGTKELSVGAGGSQLAWDVIGSFFGDPETSGAVEITFDPSVAGITAGSRTYTPEDSPTNGAGIPALPRSDAKTRGIFWGLSANGGNLTSGFRSNAGAYNPNDTPVDVTFTMYDGDGNIAGSSWTRTFGPHEPYQVNIFNVTGNGSVVTQNYSLRMTATAPVFGYVTVNDNLSGDQIFVNAADDR